MGLSVTPVGVGAAYARVGEIQSCYLVRAGETTVCLDLGSGALNALQAHVAPESVDAFVISHRHPDHCVDLLALHIYTYWGPGGRRQRRIIAPSGVEEALRAVGSETGWSEALGFEVVDDGAQVVVGEATLTFASVPHIDTTLAVRVDCDGQSVAFSADCVDNEALVRLARNADVLIAEAGDGPNPIPESLHMCGAEAGGIAQRAGVGTLLLTHCFPEHDRDATLASARAAYPGGQVDWATQGTTFGV